MGLWTDIVGSVRGYIRLGLTGVRLKNSSGALAVRNADDSADAAVTTSKVNVSGDSIDINSDAAGSGADWKYTVQRPTSGMTAAVTLTLPPDDGTSGQVLQTDGNGVLTWVSAGGFIANAGAIAWPKRTASPRIVGDIGGTSLTTFTLTASRQYFVPFTVPRGVTLTGLRISVTTASAGTASVGIYGNTVVSGSDAPGALLASATGLDTGTIGNKDGALSLTLQPGTIYWASLISSAGATVRALAIASVQTSLGRPVSSNAVISSLYVAGSGSTMPDPAPTALTDGTGTCPAIYLLEN